jgi:hypothetical protein
MSTCIDTASAAERLGWKCAGFIISKEVATAIKERMVTKLADAMMVALVNCFECLSNEDVHILVDFYTTALSAEFFNIKFLRPQHFEAICAEMEHEEEGKVTIKMILDLRDIPK